MINPKDAEKILSRHREAGLDGESTIALPKQYEAVARIEPSKLTVAEANALADML